MQTVYTPDQTPLSVASGLVWVYTVCKGLIYVTLGLNGLSLVPPRPPSPPPSKELSLCGFL